MVYSASTKNLEPLSAQSRKCFAESDNTCVVMVSCPVLPTAMAVYRILSRRASHCLRWRGLMWTGFRFNESFPKVHSHDIAWTRRIYSYRIYLSKGFPAIRDSYGFFPVAFSEITVLQRTQYWSTFSLLDHTPLVICL